MTSLRLNKAHYPVTVLGPGRRIGIWFQGCSVHCAGCVSRDTWDPAGGAPVAVPDLLAWCKGVAAAGALDGITISGGEPFEQPGALTALLRELDAWRAEAGLDFDILCYSGLPKRRLSHDFARQLELIDVLCPEPYVETLAQSSLWRGSPNQPLLGLSDRGKRLLSSVDASMPSRRFQLDVRDGRVWFIGIPDRGDMKQVEMLAATRGVQLDGISWMP